MNKTEEIFINSLNTVKDYIQFSYMKQKYNIKGDFNLDKLKDSMKYVNFIVERINKKLNNNLSLTTTNNSCVNSSNNIINLIKETNNNDDFDDSTEDIYFTDEKFIIDNINNLTKKDAIKALTYIYLKNGLNIYSIRKRLKDYFCYSTIWSYTKNALKLNDDRDVIIKEIKNSIEENKHNKKSVKYKKVNLYLNKYYKYVIVDSIEVGFNEISLKDLKNLNFIKKEHLISCIYVDRFRNDKFGKNSNYISLPLRHDKFITLKTAYQPYKTKETFVKNYNYNINNFSSHFLKLPNFNLKESKIKIVVLKKIGS